MTYVTLSVWSGWTVQSRAVAPASHDADRSYRPPNVERSSVRRTIPKSSSAHSRWIATLKR